MTDYSWINMSCGNKHKNVEEKKATKLNKLNKIWFNKVENDIQ